MKKIFPRLAPESRSRRQKRLGPMGLLLVKPNGTGNCEKNVREIVLAAKEKKNLTWECIERVRAAVSQESSMILSCGSRRPERGLSYLLWLIKLDVDSLMNLLNCQRQEDKFGTNSSNTIRQILYVGGYR
jgi:hypothetical protein